MNAINIYLFHIRAQISLYQINTDKCTRMSLNHHFNNIIRQSKIFQPLKGHLQGAHLMYSGSVGQKKLITSCKILEVKTYLQLRLKYVLFDFQNFTGKYVLFYFLNFTTGDSFC